MGFIWEIMKICTSWFYLECECVYKNDFNVVFFYQQMHACLGTYLHQGKALLTFAMKTTFFTTLVTLHGREQRNTLEITKSTYLIRFLKFKFLNHLTTYLMCNFNLLLNYLLQMFVVVWRDLLAKTVYDMKKTLPPKRGVTLSQASRTKLGVTNSHI